MQFIINALVGLGTAIFWLVETFFPYLLKKFGLAAVKFAIQKTVSALLIALIIAFWGVVTTFLVTFYGQFKDVMDIVSSPASHVGGGVAGSYFSCFLTLLDASGFSSGFRSGIAVTISIFIFMITRVLYETAIYSLKLFSDELGKLLSSGN